MPSPLASGAALIHAATLTANLADGWAFYEKLKANGAAAASGNGDVLKQVAGGEKLFGMVVDFMAIREKQKGAPVALRVSAGGRVGDRRAGRDPEIDQESRGGARLRGVPAVARGPRARAQAGLHAGASAGRAAGGLSRPRADQADGVRSRQGAHRRESRTPGGSATSSAHEGAGLDRPRGRRLRRPAARLRRGVRRAAVRAPAGGGAGAGRTARSRGEPFRRDQPRGADRDLAHDRGRHRVEHRRAGARRGLRDRARRDRCPPQARARAALCDVAAGRAAGRGARVQDPGGAGLADPECAFAGAAARYAQSAARPRRHHPGPVAASRPARRDHAGDRLPHHSGKPDRGRATRRRDAAR